MTRTIVLAACMGVAAAASAAADPVTFLPFGGDGTLRPDETVEVRWTGAPEGVEELELLLSLDGGRHFGIRVTPDLDADRGSYQWRVPPFPSADARLAIRVNLGGREVLAGLSAPFRIASDHAAHAWSMRARDGEIWVTGLESAADDPGTPFERLAGAGERRLVPCWLAMSPLAPPSPRPALNRSEPVAGRTAARDARARPASRADRGRHPAESPLRI